VSDRPKRNSFPASPFPGLEPREARTSELAIQRLVRADDLSVVFQPIVALPSLKIFAYEALVRCSVPALASPPVLFARAVADGCTGRLGRMVREVATSLCPGIQLFLNVHPVELAEGWLVRPDDPIYLHDSRIYLEVTESVPLTEQQLCHSVLREVRERARAGVVVDDLGAGFSNLKYIADLEPEVVKLDRALVAQLDQNARQRTLVKSLVSLCADLGAKVVAEGVETASELEAVMNAGVPYAQGYLIARPSFPPPLVTEEALAAVAAMRLRPKTPSGGSRRPKKSAS